MTFMSSGHNPDHTTSIHRKKGDGSVVDVECPVSIVDYNQYMGGVDKGDQYRQYYNARIKSQKSHTYLFWFVYEVCVLNAFILCHYSPCNIPISTYLSFKKTIVGADLSSHKQSFIIISLSIHVITHLKHLVNVHAN